MQSDLSDKTVLVTGAARGIGRAISEAFAGAGASVLLSDVLTREGEAASQEINASGGRSRFITHDVCDDAAWKEAIAAAGEYFGGLDFLVNNAGIEITGMIPDLELSSVRKLFDINLFGVMLGVKHGLSAMRPGGIGGKGGAIVNIASAAAITSGAGLSVYGASKAAVLHFTKNAAIEASMLECGVRVNCIMPGMTQTRMSDKLCEDFVGLGLSANAQAMHQAMATRIPMRRYARPSEIASVALFLCSEWSSYMNGACLPVDGAVSLI